MISEEVIVQTLAINHIGEKVHFQIMLPEDTTKIIGLEYDAIREYMVPDTLTITTGDLWSLYPNQAIGRLALSVPGRENKFFEGHLVEDRNVWFGEIEKGIFQKKHWTHGRKREELMLQMSGTSTLLEGFFSDSWGLGELDELRYKLHLYLWIEKCVK